MIGSWINCYLCSVELSLVNDKYNLVYFINMFLSRRDGGVVVGFEGFDVVFLWVCSKRGWSWVGLLLGFFVVWFSLLP